MRDQVPINMSHEPGVPLGGVWEVWYTTVMTLLGDTPVSTATQDPARVCREIPSSLQSPLTIASGLPIGTIARSPFASVIVNGRPPVRPQRGMTGRA